MYSKIVQLKFAAADGKFYATDCSNTETIFHVIQSIPSPKVEPLKHWLAKVGKERIDEIEDPQLAMERMKGLYEKGVPPWPVYSFVFDSKVADSKAAASYL